MNMVTSRSQLQALTWEEVLFHAFYRMIQIIRIHQDNNQLVKLCIDKFQSNVACLALDTDLTLMISDGRFYVQGEKLQYRKELVRLINALLDFFKRRGLQGLRFAPLVREIPGDELLAFVRLLIRCTEADAPAEWLSKALEKARHDWVFVIKGEEIKRKNLDDLREKARNTYLHALQSVKDVAQRISIQGHAGVRKAKRMVQNMLDCLSEDEDLFLCLSTIKDYDDYTYSHSVNVAVLALCLGHRMGLSRNSLEHLGICGLFHDLGKVNVPREILTKPGDLTEKEWDEMRKHPMSSVRQILKLRASHDLKSKIILAPFEHHIKYDLSGYPRIHFKTQVSLFGRILQIADVFDAMTSPRSYRSFALSPDQAIAFMMEGAGTDYDPVLLKVFAIMMGTYPVGSLLELDTGEMGVVSDYPMESGGHLPRVVLLEKDKQGNLRKGETVSLAEKNEETGESRRNVIRTLNPATYGIKAANFLF